MATKKNLPKWQRKLSAKERAHLKQWGNTLRALRENGTPDGFCLECQHILKKVEAQRA